MLKSEGETCFPVQAIEIEDTPLEYLSKGDDVTKPPSKARRIAAKFQSSLSSEDTDEIE